MSTIAGQQEKVLDIVDEALVRTIRMVGSKKVSN
ncbi:protein of unknown function [Caballeronia sp. S22]